MKAVGPPLYADSTTAHAIVEDCLLGGWLSLIERERGNDALVELIVEDCELVPIDGGGACFGDQEPITDVIVDGATFHIMLRQIEFAVPHLREVSNNPDLGDYVIVAGRWRRVILTPATGKKVADLLDADLAARQGEVDAVWERQEQLRAKMGPKAILPTREQVRQRNQHG